MMQFRCGSTDLCFNDGQCITSDGSGPDVCLCPNDAFGPDHSWFHDPSCTMPKKFFLGQFVEHTIASFMALALLSPRLSTERGRSRLAVIYCMMGTVSLWLFSLGVYVQDGTFEVAGFFLTLCLLACSMCGLQILMVQVSALKGIDQFIEFKLLARSLRITTVACFAVSAAIGATWVALARTDKHNIVVLISLISITFWNSIYVAEVVYFCTRLIHEIAQLGKSVGNQIRTSTMLGWEVVVSRLKAVRLGMLVYYAMLLIGVVPLWTTKIILGTVPYGFVLLWVAIHCPVVLCVAVYYLTMRRRTNQVLDNKRDENHKSPSKISETAVEATPQ